MNIQTLVVTPFQQNARVIFDEEGGGVDIIDPGGDIPSLLKLLGEDVTTVNSIIYTHSHIDHVGGVARFLRELEKRGIERPKILGNINEKAMRQSIAEQAEMFGLSSKEYENCPEPDEYLEEGDTIRIGGQEGRVLFTPGHSPGHLSYFFDGEEPLVFSGDVLFASSIGRTDLPGGDFDTLIESIKQKLFQLPDATRVLSGHGPETTIGEEKKSNPFCRLKH